MTIPSLAAGLDSRNRIAVPRPGGGGGPGWRLRDREPRRRDAEAGDRWTLACGDAGGGKQKGRENECGRQQALDGDHLVEPLS